jgi:hypothetical protein
MMFILRHMAELPVNGLNTFQLMDIKLECLDDSDGIESTLRAHKAEGTRNVGCDLALILMNKVEEN